MVEKGPAEKRTPATARSRPDGKSHYVRPSSVPNLSKETPNGSRGPLSSKTLRSADDARESGV